MDQELERQPFNPDLMRHSDVPREWNALSKRVIGCAMEVHSILGPGLVERLYEEAMVYELRGAGLGVAQQVPIRIRYKSIELGEQKIDLVVEGLLVLELKAVDRLHDVHSTQLVSYLRSADFPLGLLINFNQLRLADGLRRHVNPHSTRFPRKPDPTPRPSAPSESSAFLP